MRSLREETAYLAILAALGVTACSPPVRPGDDVVEDVASSMDACFNCSEGGRDAGIDASDAPDADALATDAREAGPDALDVVVPPGRCMPIGAGIKVANETRRLARPVYVQVNGTSFVASNVAQRGGLDNAFLTRVGDDGARIDDTNVSEEFGARVEGGAIALDGAGYVVTYSTNAEGAFSVYARRVMAGGGVMGAPVRVTSETSPFSSLAAQVVPVPGGAFLVVWRSQDDTVGRNRLMAVPLDRNLMPGVATPVTDMMANPGAFELVADGSRIAVVYVDAQTSVGADAGGPSADAYVQQLTPMGTLMGSRVALTRGAIISDSLGAALRGDDLWALWAERVPGSSLHARHLNLASGMLGPQRDYPEAGIDVSKVDVAIDGMGLVAAFRQGSAMGGTIGMLRLTMDLVPREGVSAITMASTGDVVHVVSRGDGYYLLGWSDDVPTGTIATAQLVQCP